VATRQHWGAAAILPHIHNCQPLAVRHGNRSVDIWQRERRLEQPGIQRRKRFVQGTLRSDRWKRLEVAQRVRKRPTRFKLPWLSLASPQENRSMAVPAANNSRFTIERLEDRIAPSAFYFCNDGSDRHSSRKGSSRKCKSSKKHSSKKCKSSSKKHSSKKCKGSSKKFRGKKVCKR
jgi:hypothetical protein